MPKAVMLMFTSPSSPAAEAEYNEWYTSTHVPDVLKVPGIKSATRYKLAESPAPGAAMPTNYLAVYEVEADDLNEITEGLGKAFVNGELPMSDTLQAGPMIFFEQISDTQTSS